MMFAPSQKQRSNSDSNACLKKKCRCGLEAALKVSSSGRKYLGCPRRAASGQQCEFTRMLPDNAQEGTLPTHTDHLAERSITESQNEPDPNLTALQPFTVTPPVFMKRAMENEEDHQLLPSQKRARIIEAVLKQDFLSALQKQTITTPQEALGRSNSFLLPKNEAPLTAVSKPSFLPTLSDGSGEDNPEVRAEDMALVNGSSQMVGSSSGKTGSSSLDTAAPSSRAVNADKAWLLQTPKRTEFANTPVFSSPELSPFPMAGKAAVVLSDESPSKKRYSALSVNHTLEDLSGLPNYLRTLERGHEIKDMKIKHLENEVQRLKSRQEELEKLLQMYEQHSPIIDQGA